MTWTNPKTWNIGDVLTAADMNTHVRDNTLHLFTRATSNFINVKSDYGAVGNGVTNDLPVIQSAIDDCAAAGGGIVFFPAGTYLVNGSIIIKDRVTLEGAGHRATWIKLGNAQNIPVIDTYVSPDNIISNATHTRIANLALDGNVANQTVGTNAHGVRYNSSPTGAKATNDWEFDTFHILENVLIWKVKGNGVDGASRQSSQYKNVWVYYADGYGFKPSYDTVLNGCVSGNTGLAGFFFGASQIQATACKAFYAGRITGSLGHGFYFNATFDGIVLTNCIAQDNSASGFFFPVVTAGAVLSGCVADSNSVASPGTYPAIDLWTSSNHRIENFLSVDSLRRNGVTNQKNALRIRQASTGNYISLTHFGMNGATVLTPVVDGAGTDSQAGNTIIVNNEAGSQSIAYAAAITPDPYAGNTVVVGNLTGNITINNPSQGHYGSELELVLTQDATGGRTITWGGAYKTGAIPYLGPNQTMVIRFHYDRTNWVRTSLVVNNSTAPAAAAISVGASPYTYRNTDGWDQMVVLSGGSVSKLEWSKDNSTFYDVGATQAFPVTAGEYLKVTYSSAPTMTKVPR